MLVTNKDKRSKKGDSKRDAARRIRRSPIEPPESRIHKNPKRHNKNACPLCGEAIEKIASGGRRKNSCKHCGACLNRGLTCASCGTNRVWHGKLGTACRGCGAAYRLADYSATKMSHAQINIRKFEELLLTEFPELRDEIKDCRGLEHLIMMEFVIFTERACRSGDWKTVERCLRLSDKLRRNGNSKIKNAVYVSYLESLPRKGEVHDRLRMMMTANLSKGWDEILDYLSKLLGRNVRQAR